MLTYLIENTYIVNVIKNDLYKRIYYIILWYLLLIVIMFGFMNKEYMVTLYSITFSILIKYILHESTYDYFTEFILNIIIHFHIVF